MNRQTDKVLCWVDSSQLIQIILWLSFQILQIQDEQFFFQILLKLKFPWALIFFYFTNAKSCALVEMVVLLLCFLWFKGYPFTGQVFFFLKFFFSLSNFYQPCCFKAQAHAAVFSWTCGSSCSKRILFTCHFCSVTDIMKPHLFGCSVPYSPI